MPSINPIIMFLVAALLASLTIASPIQHLERPSDTDLSIPSLAPTIDTRNSVTNGWMNWYQTCRSCSLDPIRVVGWTNNVCQPVPESDKDDSDHWTSDNTQWIQPSAGYNARCWAYTGADCKGKQSKEFDADGTYTGQLFGKHYKVYQSFWCTCDDKCVVATDVDAREAVAAPPAWSDARVV